MLRIVSIICQWTGPNSSLGSHAIQTDTGTQKPHSTQRLISKDAGASGGKKTLAHPDYDTIQSMWHTTRNQGKQPADFNHGSHKKVWLQCPGCRHGCGRQHEWEVRACDLTKRGGRIVCPCCESRSGNFCECQSVAANERLVAEWHPDSPHATEVAGNSNVKYLWTCPNGHAPYEASCYQRIDNNTGCPACFGERTGKRFHPLLSVGRPDLAEEWEAERNNKSPSEVTLGSARKAWWRCRDNPEHLWQARVRDRALKATGCPECTGANRFKPRKFGSA